MIGQKKFTKIRGIFPIIDKLVEKLLTEQTDHIRYKADQSLSVEILSTKSSDKEKSTSSLNGQFVSSQLLIECLVNMEANINDKKELIDLCKRFYASNPSELSIINEFEKSYTSERALWWYTRESFLYRLLNKALRVQDIEVLFLFRFFVRDLHQQLKELQMTTPICVYRGQLISKTELEALKKTDEKFISMNSFLSTSVDRRLAISFLYSSTASSDFQRVLFEFELDPKYANSKPFANIVEKSFFVDEEEVLIMLGSIFRLIKVEQQEGICVIRMALCGDDDNQLKSTMDYVKREYDEINGQSTLFSFVVLLFKAGKYDKAEKFLRRLLDQLPPDDSDLPGCYHNLGMITNHRGQYEESLQWMNKALEIYRNNFSSDNPKVALTLNSLGEVYYRQGKYDDALKLFQEALEIRKKVFGDENLMVAKCYQNIGNLYQQEKKLNEAFEYHQKSFIIRQKKLPPDHPELASSHHCLGSVYLCCNQPALAMQHYQQALNIYQKFLPDDHTDIGMIHYNLGLLHAGQANFQQALTHFKQAKVVFQANLDSNHPFIATVNQDIQRVSSLMR